MLRNRLGLFAPIFLCAFLFAVQLFAQTPGPAAVEPPRPPKADEKLTVPGALSSLAWRSIGPANMGGRVSDVEGIPGDPNTVFVATGSGGLWKTTNGGLRWTPIFEREGTISIGDIALEPGNPDVIWVGTGEGNPRNSVSFGDGVYKSTDGGKTWKHMGLKETNTISKIVINPKNPDHVFVAAIGNFWTTNPDRGVFMTTDGGKTWTKTLYIDDKHGASDLEIDPVNPNIVYAGMWRFERKPWTFTSGSEQGGLFRSIDGGITWKKVTMGLPKMIGRIGLSVAASNPNVVYAIAESKEGALFRSDDKGETFRLIYRQQNIVSRGFYYTTVKVDPTDENKVYAVATNLYQSIDGGRTFNRIAPTTHIDYHALWIDPKNPKRMWQGQDGGVAVTYDGVAWDYLNNFAIGQFYQVFADNAEPFYNLSGGLQDNGSWVGPGRNREPTGIHNDDWRMVSFGDGFFSIAHPDNPDLFLTESQGGNVVRTDMKTREQQLVVPYLNPGGAAENNKFRFNWNAPLVPSPHDKNTVYIAGNVVFKSTDFGLNWTQISPDLTTNNPERLKNAGGPIAFENSSAEYYCTIISLAESKKQPGMIWAGTDDGNLQLTIDGGKTWANLTKNVPGLPADSMFSHIEPSRASANLAYVAFERHKLGDYKPYIFKTADGGRSFTNITGNLPGNAFVHVVTEDPKNANLLYAGTELGLFASLNGGGSWFELNLKNLPKVAVHDVLVHPRDNDLILATHGRSLWVLDDATPIQQMSENALDTNFNLYDIRPAHRFAVRMTRYGVADRIFQGPNPPSGAIISYFLKDKPDAKTPVKMEVFDAAGKKVTAITSFPKERGVNRAVWNLSYEGARLRRPPPPEFLEFFGAPRGPQALPGFYTIKLTVGDKTQEKRVEVRVDPNVKVTAAELQKQFDMGMKLRDMVSEINDTLRAMDSLKLQAEQIETVYKERMGEMPAEMAKALADYKKAVDSTLGSLARPQSDGIPPPAKFADLLGNLYFGIGGGNAGPTKAMVDEFARLQAEMPGKMAEARKIFEQETPKVNQVLQKTGTAQIVVGKIMPDPPKQP
jgi:photosystem II stability/assembly factor-like uncharacterized protein